MDEYLQVDLAKDAPVDGDWVGGTPLYAEGMDMGRETLYYTQEPRAFNNMSIHDCAFISCDFSDFVRNELDGNARSTFELQLRVTGRNTFDAHAVNTTTQQTSDVQHFTLGEG